MVTRNTPISGGVKKKSWGKERDVLSKNQIITYDTAIRPLKSNYYHVDTAAVIKVYRLRERKKKKTIRFRQTKKKQKQKCVPAPNLNRVVFFFSKWNPSF